RKWAEQRPPSARSPVAETVELVKPLHAQWPSSDAGSSRSYGRSRREAFDGYAFKSNRQKECVPNDRKIAGSTARPPFGPPVVRVAARSSRLASREARKSLLFTPVRVIWGMSVKGSERNCCR